MKTVMLDPLPVEVARLIERRKRLGLDLYDEVWEGTYHMAPAARGRHGQLQARLTTILAGYAEEAGLADTGPFNLGGPDDFRVPDLGYHRQFDPEKVYYPTAAVVVEVVSPGDETYDKLPFYASHGVGEVIIVDPADRLVRILALAEGRYREVSRSSLLGIGASDIQAAIRWP